jgi:hypothetical protein
VFTGALVVLGLLPHHWPFLFHDPIFSEPSHLAVTRVAVVAGGTPSANFATTATKTKTLAKCLIILGDS